MEREGRERSVASMAEGGERWKRKWGEREDGVRGKGKRGRGMERGQAKKENKEINSQKAISRGKKSQLQK